MEQQWSSSGAVAAWGPIALQRKSNDGFLNGTLGIPDVQMPGIIVDEAIKGKPRSRRLVAVGRRPNPGGIQVCF